MHTIALTGSYIEFAMGPLHREDGDVYRSPKQSIGSVPSYRPAIEINFPK